VKKARTDFLGSRRWRVLTGDCAGLLARVPTSSVDAVISDPIYPGIDRDYGRIGEAEWFALMKTVVRQSRRVLTHAGSAAFVLQANGPRVGVTSGWLWKFMAWLTQEWNVVQDLYWWNYAAMPTAHANRKIGLTRPSVKLIAWCGPPGCYRNQDAVLWSVSQATRAADRGDRAIEHHPSTHRVNRGTIISASDGRGGSTPFNLIPLANTNSSDGAGANGHGAGTPRLLCEWLVKYLCPPGGVVCDPFSGSGSVGRAALKLGRRYLGIEQHAGHAATSRRLLRSAFGGRGAV
jgi:hypothetical protein